MGDFVALSVDGFLDRLRQGKPVHCEYSAGELRGLISAWKLDERFIVTWEECPVGQVYDESTYTRDERHEFAGAEDVLTFVTNHGFEPRAFTP